MLFSRVMHVAQPPAGGKVAIHTLFITRQDPPEDAGTTRTIEFLAMKRSGDLQSSRVEIETLWNVGTKKNVCEPFADLSGLCHLRHRLRREIVLHLKAVVPFVCGVSPPARTASNEQVWRPKPT